MDYAIDKLNIISQFPVAGEKLILSLVIYLYILINCYITI